MAKSKIIGEPAPVAPAKGDAAAAPAAPAGSLAPGFFYHQEARATGERVVLTDEQAKARKRRSHWMALALFTFVILLFVITMTKLGANVLVRDL
jgi:hypothetical protein